MRLLGDFSMNWPLGQVSNNSRFPFCVAIHATIRTHQKVQCLLYAGYCWPLSNKKLNQIETFFPSEKGFEFNIVKNTSVVDKYWYLY